MYIPYSIPYIYIEDIYRNPQYIINKICLSRISYRHIWWIYPTHPFDILSQLLHFHFIKSNHKLNTYDITFCINTNTTSISHSLLRITTLITLYIYIDIDYSTIYYILYIKYIVLFVSVYA